VAVADRTWAPVKQGIDLVCGSTPELGVAGREYVSLCKACHSTALDDHTRHKRNQIQHIVVIQREFFDGRSLYSPRMDAFSI